MAPFLDNKYSTLKLWHRLWTMNIQPSNYGTVFRQLNFNLQTKAPSLGRNFNLQTMAPYRGEKPKTFRVAKYAKPFLTASLKQALLPLTTSPKNA